MSKDDKNAEPLTKVLLISPVPPPYGGIARWTKTMMDMDPHKLGAQLYLINTSHRKQRSDETKLAARLLSGASQIGRVLAKFMLHLLLRGRPDCVHINTSGSWGLVRDIFVLALCRPLHIRSVLHLRFGRSPELLRPGAKGTETRLLRWALHLATIVICIDEPTHRAVVSEVGDSRSALIPNFIDTAAYAPRFHRQSRNVLFLGSVVQSKGVVELLTAWRSLSVKGWTLKLVGPLSPSLDKIASELETDQTVQFVGSVEHHDAVAHMYEAAFMVLPSHTEGFPNVLLEAMATGTPILATGVGAIPDMLNDNAGVVVPPKNVEALRDSILELVSGPDVRDSVAREAYTRVNECYSADVVLAQYRHAWSGADNGSN